MCFGGVASEASPKEGGWVFFFLNRATPFQTPDNSKQAWIIEQEKKERKHTITNVIKHPSTTKHDASRSF